ncbi:MAG: tRNA 2-thiouridine(34) synthase MnmA [bacterium]|nr:tRNA 2-thiouridine(34) synthase MnmA [bacterium]
MSVYCLMSGGVDSSVAAYLLKKDGYSVTGVTMKIFDEIDCKTKSSCCGSAYDVGQAFAVAQKLGIPFKVIDLRAVFKERVIDRFIDFYAKGLTPNPCVFCNESVKFEVVFKLFDGIIATGHYARIINGKLYKGLDQKKDQSYFLCTIKKEYLERILFPIGVYKKEEVRKIAYQEGFPNYNKKDSYDICFTSNHTEFLESKIGSGFGEVFYKDKVVGYHNGYYKYTYGQRIKTSIPKRMYVKKIDPIKKTIYVGSLDEVASKVFSVFSFNILSDDPSDGYYNVKVRSMHQEVPAYVSFKNNIVEFEENQFGITPGQVACIYKDDEVIAGGIIKEVL